MATPLLRTAPPSVHVDRLMLGIEPVDALRDARIAPPIDVVLDGVPLLRPAAAWLPVDDATRWSRALGLADAIGSLPRVPRHDSCRHALVFKAGAPGMKPPVALRVVDRTRRYAPRRIAYPAPADINVDAPRVRRPALFPGAAYVTGAAVTGLRGRALWSASAAPERPARWVRVEATIDGRVVGRAHGDDRGEFLLLLDNAAGGLGDLPSPLIVRVTVFGPPAPLALPAADPYGDLPLESLAADPDDISPGTKLPPGYAATATSGRDVTFELGRLLAGQPPFCFQP